MKVDDYLALPYAVTLVEERPADGEPPVWSAEVPDLPGCTSQGDSPEDAIDSVREAMGAWITNAVKTGRPVPTPRPEEDYSGRFLTRVPRSLHAELVREAQREGISLNQFVTNVLSGAVRWRSGAADEPLETVTVSGYALDDSSV